MKLFIAFILLLCPILLFAQESKKTEENNPAVDHSKHHHHPGMSMPAQEDTAQEGKASAGHDHSSHAEHAMHMRADAIAPAGVMGAHMHAKGEWIIDLRYMGMQMEGNRSATSKVNNVAALYFEQVKPIVTMPTGSLLAGGNSNTKVTWNPYRYMSIGEDMTMEMTMLSAMYQSGENVMLMAMLPVVKNRMTMLTSNFDHASMKSAGTGDASFTSTFRMKKLGNHELFLAAGISIPTGSIDAKATMPMMGLARLAYPMQTGAGTYAFLPGFAYTGRSELFSWGLLGQATIFYGKNDSHYRPGHRSEYTAWAAINALSWCSVSLRLRGSKWENIEGADPALDPKMDPANDPTKQAGSRVDALIGANLFANDGWLEGMRAGMEVGVPVRERLDGPQMSTSRLLNLFMQFPIPD